MSPTDEATGVRVAVGSTNPVKVAATELALSRGDALSATTVEAVAVDSGVADQPRGVAETVEGAVTRARRALGETRRALGETATDRGDDLGVGIEGGVAEREGVDGLYLVMWAAVTDGDRVGRGAGPSLRLPSGVAARVREGAELGPVMDDLTGDRGVKHDQGAAGVLTGGHTDRERALAAAVAGALGPVVTDWY